MDRNQKKMILMISVVLPVICVMTVAWLLLIQNKDMSFMQNEKRHIFGVTFMTMNNPYYECLDTRMRAVIEENGDILLTRDAALSQKRQNEEIRELIDNGAEVIFITCVDWEKAEEGIQIAVKENVPVVVLDAPVKNDEAVTCTIVSDNYKAGVLCARHLLSVRDSAKILLLEHTTTGSGTDRIQGFIDTIQGNENYEIVGSGETDGQIESSMPVMEELLKNNPQVDTVMALNDPSALGAMAAIEGAGLADRFLVYGVDGSPEAKALIKDEMMTATCAQFPYEIAKTAVLTGYEIINGMQVDHRIVIPVELITQRNIDRFDLVGWQ